MRDDEEYQFRIQLGQATNLAHEYFLASQNREPSNIEIQELIECKYLPMLKGLEQYFMEQWRGDRIKRLQEAKALIDAERQRNQAIPIEPVFDGVQVQEKQQERKDEFNLEL
jgi:hypothetical protein